GVNCPACRQELYSCLSRRFSVSRQPTGLGRMDSRFTTTSASASLLSRLPSGLAYYGSHSETGDRSPEFQTDPLPTFASSCVFLNVSYLFRAANIRGRTVNSPDSSPGC